MILLFVIDLFGVRIKLCFSFFAVIALTGLLGGAESKKIVIMLACCFLHEMGHIAAMLYFGLKPAELTLYGAGIMLTPPEHISSFAQDAIILASGCTVNFLLAFAVCFVSGKLTFFAQTNLLLGGFNLLPVGCLDGARLIELAFDGAKVKTVKAAFALLVSAFVMTCGILGSVSVSLMCVLAYMCFSIFAA